MSLSVSSFAKSHINAAHNIHIFLSFLFGMRHSVRLECVCESLTPTPPSFFACSLIVSRVYFYLFTDRKMVMYSGPNSRASFRVCTPFYTVIKPNWPKAVDIVAVHGCYFSCVKYMPFFGAQCAQRTILRSHKATKYCMVLVICLLIVERIGKYKIMQINECLMERNDEQDRLHRRLWCEKLRVNDESKSNFDVIGIRLWDRQLKLNQWIGYKEKRKENKNPRNSLSFTHKTFDTHYH